jgi:hypothetical protein
VCEKIVVHQTCGNARLPQEFCLGDKAAARNRRPPYTA